MRDSRPWGRGWMSPGPQGQAHRRPRAVSTGLKDWEKRLVISDRAHLGESQGFPARL